MPRRHAALAAILLLLIAGCQPSPRPGVEDGPPLVRAEQLLAAGEAQAAAELYADLAAQADSPERDALLLRAAQAALQGALAEQAQTYLKGIDPPRLEPNARIELRLAEARLALLQDLPAVALERLPLSRPDLPPELQIELRDVRAQALAAAGRLLEAAREYVGLDALLFEPEAVQENRNALWAALGRASSADLYAWATQAGPGPLRGWLELAYIARATPPAPAALEAALVPWEAAYPDHPARLRLVGELREQWTSYTTYPARVGVILPLSGRFAAVGEAVLDGIMTAYYATDAAQRPALRVYDAGENPADILRLYNQAVNEGAEFVLGPLDKASVGMLLRSPQLPVPMLTLNYADDGEPGRPELRQFGLLPEDEARQVAERMSLDGHLTAAAFVPQGDWGQRLLNAFTERFEALGGIVIAREVFPPDGNDYAGPIRRAFALTQSENRNRRLRAATKIPVEFEPRRRQDIDAIFLAAAPRQARSLRPQLDFHRAQDLPVYATSHVYAGTPDPRADSDLRRMVFTDIPWLLEPGPSAPLKAAAEASLPTAAQRFPRLLALGVDAFRLLPYLERLATQPQERFEGATGHLSIDDQGRVHRELKWGEFVSGRASLVSIDAAELLGDAPPQ